MKGQHPNAEGCYITGLSVVVVVLFIYMLVDLSAGWRDLHHIRDLQHRIAILEQGRK